MKKLIAFFMILGCQIVSTSENNARVGMQKKLQEQEKVKKAALGIASENRWQCIKGCSAEVACYACAMYCMFTMCTNLYDKACALPENIAQMPFYSPATEATKKIEKKMQ